MFLHAWRLTVPHPVTGAALRLEAELPQELRDVLSRVNLAPPEEGAPAQGRRRPAAD
jgi:23S rRNA pseudouridine955/2504/2580 synthase